MLLFRDGLVKMSVKNQCEPCTFKALWFSDSAVLSPNRSETDLLLLVLGFLYAVSSWIRQYLTCVFTARLDFLLSLHIHVASFSIVTSCIWIDSEVKRIGLRGMPTLKDMKPDTMPRSQLCLINRLPTEIRLKILENLVEGDTLVKAVGYSNGAGNHFLLKEKGYCPLPIMLTCKQLYLDMRDVYFRNISLTFKAAFPSSFDGDMASFASAFFRDNVRSVKISDPDLQRRRKIAAAFRRAVIEFRDKGASGSRKGAYYFV